jgi:predicted nucleic-acid-binding Zn-ribbon protein
MIRTANGSSPGRKSSTKTDMRANPYLDEILGRGDPSTDLVCAKCGARKFYTRHLAATPALKLWRWVLITATPEHLRYTCSNCDYAFTAPVGTYRAKSNA